MRFYLNSSTTLPPAVQVHSLRPSQRSHSGKSPPEGFAGKAGALLGRSASLAKKAYREAKGETVVEEEDRVRSLESNTFNLRPIYSHWGRSASLAKKAYRNAKGETVVEEEDLVRCLNNPWGFPKPWTLLRRSASLVRTRWEAGEKGVGSRRRGSEWRCLPNHVLKI